MTDFETSMQVFSIFCRKPIKIVVFASIAFIVLVLPRSAFFFLREFWDPGSLLGDGNGYFNQISVLVDDINMLLQYTNHAINPAIYILSFKKLCSTWR